MPFNERPRDMGTKLNLVIDVALCENCNNCVLAAKDELVGNTFDGYSAPHAPVGEGVVRIERHVRGEGHMVDVTYVPRMCFHCDNAPCVAAGQGAVRKRQDGVVLFDPVLARGRRDLVAACPYGAVVWNEEQQLPQTWFFDAHLLDAGWEVPRSAGVCPTGAIQLRRTDDDAMQREVASRGLRTLLPELALKPRVFYANLDRVDRVFVGGTITARIGPHVEVVPATQVELVRADEVVATCVSDAFGDFKFDGLLPHGGEHQIRARHSEHGEAVCAAAVGAASVFVGELRLSDS
ncbi:Fe-S-cluster-containing dehydrogenase component [Hydrogenophaga palleronii]|uniref:Fe-S-cluster-containing dehydrogenase component n=1 Tax=Hydrogenophaga palleronii TaxID=65655 RepID=A0ABU1WRU7_9BURK|nr:4Fe-4S dicluster domain-containing protein [Hydrogenophaga palleronii]MDR7152022.1 Fe-S-cluster-containing dehydrogenase component [Hydrogenophaga palleronii]